jgi:PLP dependent protein
MTGPQLDAREVADRLIEVRQRIARAGADPATVRICAGTKGFGTDAVHAAVALGLVDIGENYAQELVRKAEDLAAEPAVAGAVRWHMIGAVQRNKVRLLAPHVALWQTVDRPEVGAEIARRAPGAAVLVQVNATAEAAKAGVAPPGVPALVDRLAGLGLDVRGLMTIGPTDLRIDPRPMFETVAALGARLGLIDLSMGMSGDLEAAVECGATIVRVGTALFGPRPPGVTAPPGSPG